MLSKEITRWSLSSLARLNTKNPESARHILTNVADRLTLQHVRLDRLSDNTSKNLRHLQYIHVDTARLCQQLLTTQVLDRWTDADQRLIASTLEQVRDRHATTMERLVELDATTGATGQLHSIVQARWGIQLLCGHYVNLSKGLRGSVSVDSNLLDVVDEAVVEAKHVCEAHWLTSPEIVWDYDQSAKELLPPVTFVRPWMNHTLVELLKNGMHASVQRARRDNGTNPPPMHLEFSHDAEKALVFIDIIDHGIGCDDDVDTELFFGLGHSANSGKRWDRLEEQQSYADVRSPMSSLGVGLPVSRMMMRHFGGDVQIVCSNDGCRARISVPLDADILEQALDEDDYL
jgi:pyruvate dehydrogenase kinase 2/3/4